MKKLVNLFYELMLFTIMMMQKKGSEDDTRKLSTVMYLSVDSKVVITWNLSIQNRITNGTTGTVKDFIFYQMKAPYTKINQ